VVTARLAAIDGKSVAELMKLHRGDSNLRSRGQWSLTREQRISWMKQLPPDNQIVAGKLWSEQEPNELSVEAGFARDLDVKVGSTLRFDVQGVELDFRVTSLRTVQWRSFASNFLLVAEPGSLDDAPHFRFGAVRLSRAGEDELQRELAQSFPNVTVLRVHNLLARLQSVLHQAAVAVRVLGGFAIVTGLVILMGAILGSQLRRKREAALWKTLGLTRSEVLAMFAVEYALLGAVAGVIGATGAYAVTALLARQLLQLDALPSWSMCLAAVLIAIALSVLCGLLASTRALLVRPLDVLRNRG
jgi:putative ABC transport system permease protein